MFASNTLDPRIIARQEFVFYGDSSGQTDVSAGLKEIIEAAANHPDGGQYVYVPAGKYLCNDLNPDSSIRLIVDPAARLMNDPDHSIIDWTAQQSFQTQNTIQRLVTAVAPAIYSDGFSQTQDTDFVTRLTVQGDTSQIKPEEIWLIHSSDVLPCSEPNMNRYPGEPFIVLGVSGQNVFVQGRLELESFYQTGIYINRYSVERECHIIGGEWGASGNWNDLNVDNTDGGGSHCMNLRNIPFARVENLIFRNTWAGTILFRNCPYVIADTIGLYDLPNLKTAGIPGFNGRLGYGPALYGHSIGEIRNVSSHKGRHIASMADGYAAPAADYDKDKWYTIGLVTRSLYEQLTIRHSYGPPIDWHVEGSGNRVQDVTIYDGTRGNQGGSYEDYAVHLRARNCFVSKLYKKGGRYGIRVPSVSEWPDNEHTIENCTFEDFSSSDGADAAIRVEDLSALLYPPRLTGTNIVAKNLSKVIFAQAGANIDLNKVEGKYIRRIAFESVAGVGPVAMKIHDLTLDFSRFPAGTGTINAFLGRNGNTTFDISSLDLTIGGASKPAIIFDSSIGGQKVGLKQLFLSNPTNQPNIQIMNIGWPLRYDWIGGGTPLIFDIGDETTNLTAGTSRKTLILPQDFVIFDATASLNTPSTSGDVIVDVNRNGSSIFTGNRRVRIMPNQKDRWQHYGLAQRRDNWLLNTAYIVNDIVLDDTDNSAWRCLVVHTSAATGTFAEARTANPTFWVQIGWLPRFGSSSTLLKKGNEISIDIDAAGTGAKGLKVVLLGFWV
jgi:hypothetical protein